MVLLGDALLEVLELLPLGLEDVLFVPMGLVHPVFVDDSLDVGLFHLVVLGVSELVQSGSELLFLLAVDQLLFEVFEHLVLLHLVELPVLDLGLFVA